MKLYTRLTVALRVLSPPAREVWIEIAASGYFPCGHIRHLPHGRCGLKFDILEAVNDPDMSPPAREVWIEIAGGTGQMYRIRVTSRTGGVD